MLFHGAPLVLSASITGPVFFCYHYPSLPGLLFSNHNSTNGGQIHALVSIGWCWLTKILSMIFTYFLIYWWNCVVSCQPQSRWYSSFVLHLAGLSSCHKRVNLSDLKGLLFTAKLVDPTLGIFSVQNGGKRTVGRWADKVPFPPRPHASTCDKSKIKECSIFYSEKIIPSTLKDILAFNTF